MTLREQPEQKYCFYPIEIYFICSLLHTAPGNIEVSSSTFKIHIDVMLSY